MLFLLNEAVISVLEFIPTFFILLLLYLPSMWLAVIAEPSLSLRVEVTTLLLISPILIS